MVGFLRQLLGMGLSDIFQVDEVREEWGSGSEPEIVSTTFVAKKEDGFVSVATKFCTNKYQPFRGNISQPKLITAAEYEELAAGKLRLDSPQAIAQLKAEYEQQVQADKLTPECPQCEVSLRQKIGPKGLFWGCKNYPKCKNTKVLTQAQRNFFEVAN